MGEFNVNKSDGSLEQTAGMPSEYPASQVMMSDGVTSVEDALDASTFGTAVDISSYNTPGNKYTAPSDGYAMVRASSSGALALLAVESVYITASQSGGVGYASIYVKKGMRMYINYQTGTIEAYFYPLQ